MAAGSKEVLLLIKEFKKYEGCQAREKGREKDPSVM
jgi:hypothetical protein